MSRMFFPVEFFILSFVLNHVYGMNQHMICKTVDDVFTNGSINPDSNRPHNLQGPQGKRGPQGVKGETGLPGSLDPQMIENIVEEKVNAANRILQDRIENLERQVAELNSIIAPSPVDVTTTVSPDTVCDEGIIHRRKCYYAIIHDNTDVNLAKANNLCRESGGRLADIYNLEHQVLVENYIRQKASGSYRLLWLGMTYLSSTRTLLLSNGAAVSISSFRWHSTYPYTHPTAGISVDGTTSGYGLFNNSPEYTTNGSLCVK